MPKIGDTIEKEKAKELPATPFEIERLCDSVNRRLHRFPQTVKRVRRGR